MKQLHFFVFVIVLSAFLFSCSNNADNTENTLDVSKPGVYSVIADVETDPVPNDEDAADDPCIWYNENDPEKSRILGTNKRGGLVVYDLDGKELYSYPVGRVNNVDIRYDFAFDGKNIDIVGATNRSHNSISLFKVISDGQLEELSISEIVSETQEVYGFGFYQSRISGKLYATQVAKSGIFEQYEISDDNGEIKASLVRTIEVGSQCEGIVADDEMGIIYIGEENSGVWKFNAEPGISDEGTRIIDLSNENLMADIEGLTIYYGEGGMGYLIVSSQGNNSFAVYTRSDNNDYLGSFVIVDSESIDGTTDTDGIDVINMSLGSKFPQGLFIAQDGYNKKGAQKLNQNFKVVDWSKIAMTFQPNLLIDTNFDFRK